MKKFKPAWMRDFKETHGIWPIAGGSGQEAPPSQEGEQQGQQQDGITVTEDSRAPDTSHGMQPPAQPAPTHSVDPGRFNQGAGEQGGQPPAAQPAPGETNPQTGRTFTEAEVEAIRQQEKDKLYGRINEMDETIKEMRDRLAREQEEEAAREQEEERKRRAQEEEELDVRELLQRKEQEWNEKFEQIEQERKAQESLLEKERQYNALQEYKRNKVAQHEDDIMPQLRDLIAGNSEEEIDASINAAIEKTNSIIGDVAATQQQQRQAVPTARVTMPGDGGPIEQTENAQRVYSPEDINNMSMAEYAKHRDKLLGGASQKARSGGLYG